MSSSSSSQGSSPDLPSQPPHQRDPSSGDGPGTVICSAKGCRAPAVWVLAWNNPKVHTPERRKTWVACDDHREHLSSFLELRGFLKDVVRLSEWQENGGR